MTAPGAEHESEQTWDWRPTVGEPSTQAARLEIARRIAREALEADRQAVELDARFAFGINSGV